MTSRLLLLGAIALGSSFLPPASAQELFWTDADTGEIWTSRIDGGDPHVLISGLSRPIGITVDANSGFLYWGEDGWGVGRVARSTLGGDHVTTIVGSLGSVQAVALDKAGGKLYWTEHYENTGVSRANLDGSDVESIHSANQRYGPLALDLVNGHVYFGSPQWTFLQRMNLDGSGYTEVQPAGWAPDWTLHSLAIDPGAGKLYSTAGTAIRSSDLAGGNLETVVTGLEDPVALSLSPNAAQLFWVESTGRRLGAVTLDGGGQAFLQDNLGNPAGVAALTSYDIPPPPPPPEAYYWRFEEGSGINTADAGEGEHHGSANSSSLWSSDVPATEIPLTGDTDTGSLDFDGASFVETTTLGNFGGTVLAQHQYTIEAWVKPAAEDLGAGNPAILGVNHAGNPLFFFGHGITDGASFGYFLRTPSGTHVRTGIASNAYTFTFDQWYHIAVVVEGMAGADHRWYVNGQRVEHLVQGSNLSAETSFVDFTRPVFVGAFNNVEAHGTTDWWNGKIDEVRITTRALSALELLTRGDPDGFGGWQVEHFSRAELDDPAISGPEANPSGDGLPNLLKYALDHAPWTPSRAGTPIASVENIDPDPEPPEGVTLAHEFAAEAEQSLHEVALDVGGVAWIAGVNFHTDGNVDGIRASAIAPFTPRPGYFYELSATYDAPTSEWIAFGYANNRGYTGASGGSVVWRFSNWGDGGPDGIAWLIHRNHPTADDQSFFRGPGDAANMLPGGGDLVSGQTDFLITLDTSEPEWKIAFFINGIEHASYVYPEIPTINAVGFSLSGPNVATPSGSIGTIDRFELKTTRIAEPDPDAGEKPFLTLAFDRPAERRDLFFQVLGSASLQSWSETPVLHRIDDRGDGTVTEIWRAAEPLSGSSREFLKLDLSLR